LGFLALGHGIVFGGREGRVGEEGGDAGRPVIAYLMYTCGVGVEG